MIIAKYIIFETGLVLVFPSSFQHDGVAGGIKATPISAGQIIGNDLNFVVTGESFTLGLRSREIDKELILKYFSQE